ncbi:MAG: hypothetical protein ACFB10_00945 [Salibacteraceae bacterium]
MTSIVIEWYDSGKKQNETSYRHINGEKVLHGFIKHYYENGKLRTVSWYENGKPNGKWEGFYLEGTIKYVMLYEDFQLVGYTEYDASGKEKKKD